MTTDERIGFTEICYQDAGKYLPPLFAKKNLPVQNALDVFAGLNCYYLRKSRFTLNWKKD